MSYLNSSFDPYDQTFYLLWWDGRTVFNATLAEVDALQSSAINSAIIAAVQIGIVAMIMLLMLLVTQAEKRKTAVFIFNYLTLTLIFITRLLDCLEYTGPYYNFYEAYTGTYPDSGNAQNMSCVAEIFTFLIFVTIEGSMVFQVCTVCNVLPPTRRLILYATSVFVATEVSAVRFATAVVNVEYSILANAPSQYWLDVINKLSAASNISFVVSTFLFSFTFSYILWLAILQRHKLGLRQFGPLQIVFIMGCQTMIVPAIFGAIAFSVLVTSQLNSFAVTISALFLPLSSMWASAHTRHHDLSKQGVRFLLNKQINSDSTYRNAHNDPHFSLQNPYSPTRTASTAAGHETLINSTRGSTTPQLSDITSGTSRLSMPSDHLLTADEIQDVMVWSARRFDESVARSPQAGIGGSWGDGRDIAEWRD